MRHTLKISFYVLYTLMLTACGGGNDKEPDVPPPPPPLTAAEILTNKLTNVSLTEFYQIAYKELALRDPEAVVASGLDIEYQISNDSLTDISDAYTQETFALHAVVHDLLLQYDPADLSVTQRVSYDVYLWYLAQVGARAQSINFNFPESSYGYLGGLRYFFMGEHPLNNERDANNYIARLNALPNKIKQLIAVLKTRESANILLPKIFFQDMLGMTHYFATDNAAEHPFYQYFEANINQLTQISNSDKNELLSKAQVAIETVVSTHFSQLATFMNTLYDKAPEQIGMSQYAGGDAYYQQILNYHTTTNMTPEEVHQLGFEQLERVRAEMRTLVGNLGYSTDLSLEELYAQFAVDGGVVEASDVKSVYENLIMAATQNVQNYFQGMPETELEVVQGVGEGYYPAPFDSQEPAQFTADLTEDHAYFEMPTLAYHESIPGHHYQFSLAREANLPRFHQELYITAFSEGWGLYSEQLAAELGWYAHDDFGNLGRLKWEAIRAARLIVDTGIHYKGWSFDYALEFYNSATGVSMERGRGHITRYSQYVGQATSYMTGMLKIQAIRQQVMDALGDDFDYSEFHQLVLGNGPMPMLVLENTAMNYINTKLAGLKMTEASHQ